MSKQKTAAGSGSKRKNGRIRNKLLIFIMPVVLAALLILVVLASVNSKAIMTNMAEEQLHSSIVNQQSSIEAWLDKNMEFFSSVKHTIEAENPSDAELQSILDAYYGYNKYVPDGLYIGTKSGKFYKASQSTIEENDVANSPWFKEGITRISMNYGNPHKDENGNFVVSATGMLKNSTGDIAVLGANVPLNQVSIIVNSGVNMDGASSFLVDGNTNTILADRDSSLVSTTISVDSKDKVMAAAARAIANQNYNSLAVDGKWVDFVEIGETGWILVSQIPKDIVLADVNKFASFLLLLGIIDAVVIALIIILVINYTVKPLGELTKNIVDMSSGDFTVKVRSKSNDEIGLMAAKVGEFVGSMRSMISSISEESDKLRDESDSSANVSKLLQDSSESQADAMKQLNETVNELALAVNEIANNATTLAGVVSDTKENTSAAGESMAETVKISAAGRDDMKQLSSAMEGIKNSNDDLVNSINKVGEASGKITEIVGLISEIAEQTNLLSLNASIEAARAGEAGKGFAVVADEIGKLANNSDDSAKKIGALIVEVNGLIEETVKKAGESSESIEENAKRIEKAISTFDTIYENIQETNRHVAEVEENIKKVDSVATNVAAISEEQAASADEIQSTSENMVAQAKSIAESSEEVSENAHNLADTSGTLTGHVQKFKV